MKSKILLLVYILNIEYVNEKYFHSFDLLTEPSITTKMGTLLRRELSGAIGALIDLNN